MLIYRESVLLLTTKLLLDILQIQFPFQDGAEDIDCDLCAIIFGSDNKCQNTNLFCINVQIKFTNQRTQSVP